MSRTFLAVVAALAAAIALVSLPPVTLAGQAPASAPKVIPSAKPAASAKTWTPPKTPWGDPDIQGVWPGTDLIGVPLQRAETFGTRNVLTEAEYTQRVLQAERQTESDGEQFVKPGAAVSINPPSHWIERGRPQRMASLIVDPPNGRMPALTPEAQKQAADRAEARKLRGANESWEDQSLYDRCISRGVLGSILPVIYDNGNQIMQGPGYVAIRYEMIHETRMIPLDGRPHAGPNIRSYMGDARGHWEGNTLVVETTNFLGDRNGVGGNGGGTPHSDALRLVERITRVDAETLKYEATINDPKTWTKPWTFVMPLRRDPSYLMVEYACHEGNYAMEGILTGARADEKAAEEAAKKESK